MGAVSFTASLVAKYQRNTVRGYFTGGVKMIEFQATVGRVSFVEGAAYIDLTCDDMEHQEKLETLSRCIGQNLKIIIEEG